MHGLELPPDIGMQPAPEREEPVIITGRIDSVGQKQYPQTAVRLHEQGRAGETGMPETGIRYLIAEKAVRCAGQVKTESSVLLLSGGIVPDGLAQRMFAQIIFPHAGKHF